ncbi:MAG: hypothetical protein R6U52_09465 [Kosmotogaceae bacterium]
MTNRQEGIFALIAVFFVLFSAMLSPLVSAIVAMALLSAFAAYKLFKK